MTSWSRAYVWLRPYSRTSVNAVLTWLYMETGYICIGYVYERIGYVRGLEGVPSYARPLNAQQSDDFDFCISRYNRARRATQ